MTAPAAPAAKYLQAYPPDVQQQVAQWLQAGTLGQQLHEKYGGKVQQSTFALPGCGASESRAARRGAHPVRTDRALYDYVQAIKDVFLRGAEPLSKVRFDNKLQIVAHALGTHSTISRVQGSKLKAKREIRIAALFRDTPEPFLKMITVHELAHLKHQAHDKAFYQLCVYMEPNYHQLEFDLRLLLTHIDAVGPLDWSTETRCSVAVASLA